MTRGQGVRLGVPNSCQGGPQQLPQCPRVPVDEGFEVVGVGAFEGLEVGPGMDEGDLVELGDLADSGGCGDDCGEAVTHAWDRASSR